MIQWQKAIANIVPHIQKKSIKLTKLLRNIKKMANN